jgi:hypothetical protein
MSTKAGNLLWNRRRVSVGPANTDIDTGLRQANMSFDASSDSEPPLGISGVAPPADGSLPASRVQVIPLAPISEWMGAAISHSEPWFNTATGTVFVTFRSGNEGQADINVLFWDPHTLVGPGEADTYNAPA